MAGYLIGYFVTKREHCGHRENTSGECPMFNCNGAVETQVPLLDVLKEIFVLGEPVADLPTKIQVLPDHAWIGDDEPSREAQMEWIQNTWAED